jgi:urea transport system permease protein
MIKFSPSEGMRMSMTRRWLPFVPCAGLLLGLAAAVGATSPGSAAPIPAPPEKFVPACQDSLARAEDKSAAIDCLIKASHAAGDTSFKTFFGRVFEGAVFVADLPGRPGALVLPGDEVESGDTYVRPVRLALPEGADYVTDAAGKPLMLLSETVLELDVGRMERALIQPVLTEFELASPDPVKRRGAAQLLGETHDATFISILEAAAATERDKNVRQVMVQAAARLRLASDDAAVRLEGVNALRELKGTTALAELAALAADESQTAELRTAAAAAITSIENWMKFTEVLQNLFSGLSLGSILILMALGLAVIFGLMGVINMAHGEFMMIGAYATFLVQVLFERFIPAASGWFLAFSFPAAFLLAGGIGMVIEATIIKRLYGRPLETLLATWGVSLLLIQIARTIFGDLTAVNTPPFLGGGWEIFPSVVFPYNRLFIIVLTAVICAAMTYLFFKTSLGMKVRAVTQNRAMSACLGVRTRRLDNLTFGIGTGIAGLAGCALTQIGNVDPGMGQNYIVDSFMVVVTGGVGKLVGTVLAGLGIGTLNKFLEPVFQAVYAKVILLGLVILFLQWRPSGLFPAKGRHEDN